MSFSGARVLALDVGERRIGLAISDPLGLTAQGLPTLARRNRAADLEALTELARGHRATLLVVGLPRRLSGHEGAQAAKVRSFAERLRRHSGLRVEYWDERFTTVEASRVLRSAHTSREKTRRAIDRLAAVLLLESFLAAPHAAPEAE